MHPIRLLPLLVGLPLLPPSLLGAQACSRLASYVVTHTAPDHFGVDALLHEPARDFVVRFSEATGRPEAQAASIRDVAARDASGAVALHYLGEGRWHAERPVTHLRYMVQADHDQVEWPGGGIDEVASRFGDAWFFVGNAFFLTDPAWPACPVEVTFETPGDWAILAPWPGEAPRFTAADPAALTDNVFAVGRFTPGGADAGTMRLGWVIDDRIADIAPRFVPLVTTLPRTFAEFFGGTPAERYTVVVFAGPRMDGGSFLQSFTLELAPPVRDADAIVWSHGLAHEMLHLWIGNHIHGADPEALSWFTEGFTDYLAIKLAYRAGVIDEAMLEQRLANVIRRVRLAPVLSPGIGLEAAGREKHRHWARVYGGGAMVALLMDAADPAGFRAALRDLDAHANVAWTGEALLARMDQATDGAATRAFDMVDAGTDLGAMFGLLGKAGIEVTGFSPDEVYVRFAGGCGKPACVPAFLAR